MTCWHRRRGGVGQLCGESYRVHTSWYRRWWGQWHPQKRLHSTHQGLSCHVMTCHLICVIDSLQSLRKYFEVETTQICSAYINQLLKSYTSNPQAQWLSKDVAIYLVTALAVRSNIASQGATSVNELVPVMWVSDCHRWHVSLNVIGISSRARYFLSSNLRLVHILYWKLGDVSMTRRAYLDTSRATPTALRGHSLVPQQLQNIIRQDEFWRHQRRHSAWHLYARRNIDMYIWLPVFHRSISFHLQ